MVRSAMEKNQAGEGGGRARMCNRVGRVAGKGWGHTWQTLQAIVRFGLSGERGRHWED